MYILGVWDGHDSGAALVRDGKIIFASNEERYTRRKLEVRFPYNAINAALALINLYGVVFVLGIVLPVINVMIAIAMVQSTARLFGGDTNILGIGKLI